MKKQEVDRRDMPERAGMADSGRRPLQESKVRQNSAGRDGSEGQFPNMSSREDIVQGILWYEILSKPMCRRRRKR